jgi:hypothetical protein
MEAASSWPLPMLMSAMPALAVTFGCAARGGGRAGRGGGVRVRVQPPRVQVDLPTEHLHQ